jgi:hypothetical protein
MARDTRPPQYENYEEQDKGLGLGSAGLAALLTAGAIATPVGKPVRAALGKVIPQSVKDYAVKQAGAAAKAMNLEGGTLARARDAANTAAYPVSPNFKDSWQNLKATGAALKAGGNSIWKDAKEGLFGPKVDRGVGTQMEMDLIQPTGPRVISSGTAGPRVTPSVPVPSTVVVATHPSVPTEVVANAAKAASPSVVAAHSPVPTEVVANAAKAASPPIVATKPALDDRTSLLQSLKANKKLFDRRFKAEFPGGGSNVLKQATANIKNIAENTDDFDALVTAIQTNMNLPDRAVAEARAVNLFIDKKVSSPRNSPAKPKIKPTVEE